MQMQVNEMLQVQYINYVPAAIKAGMISILSTVLASDDLDASSRRAVLRCVRLVTDTSPGSRTVIENPEMCSKIIDMATTIMADWSATKGHPLHGKFIDVTASENQKTAPAAKELTDALYVLNSMYKAGNLLHCTLATQHRSNCLSSSCVLEKRWNITCSLVKQWLRSVRNSKRNLFEPHKYCIACSVNNVAAFTSARS
jgi:hypothetical protein